MGGRFVLVLIALIVSASLSGQEQTSITIAEWHDILNGVPTDDDNRLISLATKYSNESTDLLNSGDRIDGLNKSVISLILSKHVLDRKLREGLKVEWRAFDSLNRSQAALIRAGIPQSSMKQSAMNLGFVLHETPSLMTIKVRPMPRSATPTERKAMIVLIKDSLIDPTSPIYGRSDVVENRACFTVNSKNRFGGYTGNQEAVLLFSQDLNVWVLGGTADLSHEECLLRSN